MRQKISPNINKANSLKNNAELTIQRLNETNKLKYPTHALIDYYTAIQYLMERICYIKGLKIIGEGKHVEMIKIGLEEKSITKSEEIFIQKLREKRNRIHYEGETLSREYIEESENKIISIINKLFEFE